MRRLRLQAGAQNRRARARAGGSSHGWQRGSATGPAHAGWVCGGEPEDAGGRGHREDVRPGRGERSPKARARDAARVDRATRLAEIASAVAATLREAGVDDANVRTQNVGVQDWFDPQQQRVTARVGSYALLVTDRRLEEVGRLLNAVAAVAGDALRVHGIMLTFSDPARLRAVARQQAVEDAMAKARQLADAAGVALGRVLGVDEGSVQPWGQPQRMALLAERAAVGPPALPVEPGVQGLTVRVAMTFAIDE
jgi:uncharacterized protein YggE